MKIASLSDIHGNLPDPSNYPKDIDVFVLGGDFLPHYNHENNEEMQIQFVKDKLNPWLDKISAKHKIGNFGNHDVSMERPENRKLINCNMLQHQSIVIDGVKFYGLADTYFPPDYYRGRKNWAFGVTSEALADSYKQVDEDVCVLISHMIPFGVMDIGWSGGGMMNFGSTEFRELLDSRPFPWPKLKLLLLNHIHENGGQKLVWTKSKNNGKWQRFTIANVASSIEYHPNQPLHIFEI